MFGNIELLNYELTLENVHRHISQYEIFRYYCGDFKLYHRFNSPLRKDRNPSFAIQHYNGNYFWKDFASGESGNCISLVMKKFGVDYYGALNKLNLDFNLGLNSTTFKLSDKKPYTPTIHYKEPTKIKIKSRPFTKEDLTYWNSFGIKLETLKRYNVKSISHYWINDYLFNVRNYLSFAYEFPDGYKLYFPEKIDYKWFNNSNWIQGLLQLDKSRDILIITKSLKDVLTLEELGVSAIAPQNENIILKSVDIEKAKSIFKNIYTLFDYDNAGIHLAWQMRKLYGIQPLFLTDKLWNRKLGYLGCKDISAFRSKYGEEETKKLINGKYGNR